MFKAQPFKSVLQSKPFVFAARSLSFIALTHQPFSLALLSLSLSLCVSLYRPFPLCKHQPNQNAVVLSFCLPTANAVRTVPGEWLSIVLGPLFVEIVRNFALFYLFSCAIIYNSAWFSARSAFAYASKLCR